MNTLDSVISVEKKFQKVKKYTNKTIFCYLEEGFSKHQIKSLQATARLVKDNGAQVFTSLEEVAEYLNQQQMEARIEISLRRCPKCEII